MVHPGAILPSHILDVRFRLLPAARPLGRRTRVLLHHGTTQVMASLVLVGAARLGARRRGRRPAPPRRAHAAGRAARRPLHRAGLRRARQLRHDHRRRRDRPGPRRQGPRRRARATPRPCAASPTPASPSASPSRSAAPAPAGLDRAAIAHRTGQVADDVAATVDELTAAGELLRAGDDHAVFLHAEVVAALEARLRALLDAAPAEGAPREELRTRLPAALPRAAFDALVDGPRPARPRSPRPPSAWPGPRPARAVARRRAPGRGVPGLGPIAAAPARGRRRRRHGRARRPRLDDPAARRRPPGQGQARPLPRRRRRRRAPRRAARLPRRSTARSRRRPGRSCAGPAASTRSHSPNSSTARRRRCGSATSGGGVRSPAPGRAA